MTQPRRALLNILDRQGNQVRVDLLRSGHIRLRLNDEPLTKSFQGCEEGRVRQHGVVVSNGF